MKTTPPKWAQKKERPDTKPRFSYIKKVQGEVHQEAEARKDFADDKQRVPESVIEQQVRDPKRGHTASVPLTTAMSQTTPKLSCLFRTI